MLAVYPDEFYQPIDNVYFNQRKERHIGLIVYELIVYFASCLNILFFIGNNWRYSISGY